MDVRLVDSTGTDQQLVLPDGVEREAQQAARNLNAQLAHRRRILNSEELAALIAPRARHEQSFEKFAAHFFTVDGILHGTKIQGALFAGECILIFALGINSAQELANSGLRATIELLHKELETRELRLGVLGQGTVDDRGGRRSHPSATGRELETLPKLRAMLGHILGGLPWKW